MSGESGTVTVSVGGPVGSGKTTLVARVVPKLRAMGFAVGVIATDVTNSKDAAELRNRLDGVVPADLVTGAVGNPTPKTLDSDHLRTYLDRNPELDVILVESPGDTTSGTAPDMVDYSLFVISVAEGDDIPRKRGPGVVGCDLLVVNKTDLAEHVGANLGTIERDARTVRDGPFIFTNCKTGEGIDSVVTHIQTVVLPASS